MPDWQNKSDQELVELAQKGDREAFAEIYNRYGEAIYRYLYGHVPYEQDAEDMTADVFLNLWRTLPQYQENKKVPFYVFLYRIARNRLVDYFRRQKTRAGEIDTADAGEEIAAPRPPLSGDCRHGGYRPSSLFAEIATRLPHGSDLALFE